MRPVFSVILFTVLSGIGYGIFMSLTLLSCLSVITEYRFSEKILLLLMAYGLITTGLFCSVFHLANPINAWRSLSRIKTSWLSREALLALIFYPISFYWSYQWLTNTPAIGLSIITLLASFLTVFCTAMIYACLRTIKAWNNHFTLINYLILSLMSGFCIVYSIDTFMYSINKVLSIFCLISITIAAICKVSYYIWLSKQTTINPSSSFALNTDKIQLFDKGHTSKNFITQEFSNKIATSKSVLLQIIALISFALIPFLLILSKQQSIISMFILVVALLTGLILERWLFFINARHIVNNYY